MRAVWNFATSLGGTALLGAVALGLALGIALDDLRNALIAIGVLAVVAISVAVVTRANAQHHQINREELDDPDPFNERVIPKNHKPTDTTGDNR